MKILVTGASGFVGLHLLRHLQSRNGWSVRALLRRNDVAVPPGVEAFPGGELDGSPDCISALRGCDAVIHLAARVHVLRETEANPLDAFRRVNVAATAALANQAVAAGVRRFIFMSSIKVNGEQSAPGQPFTSASRADPHDAYAITKLEAEQGLREIALRTGLEVVTIRPPLVYGPGVKANFLSMMNWLHRGLPVPFGAVRNNRRSLIAIGNLVDVIARCVDHPAAVGATLLVADGEDLSTAELFARLGAAMARPARLVPIPPAAIALAARLAGRRQLIHRLLASLQVDASGTRRLLGWTPPLSVDEALRMTTTAYLQGRRS